LVAAKFPNRFLHKSRLYAPFFFPDWSFSSGRFRSVQVNICLDIGFRGFVDPFPERKIQASLHYQQAGLE